MDLIAKVPRLPKIGESLEGRFFHMSCGGKGANQAVMAAKLGARVHMVTKLGRDHLGEVVLKNYREMGVASRFIFRNSEASTGVAPILVDDRGRNLLIYIPGANLQLRPEDVDRARKAIETADVLICQLEIPLESTRRALQIGRNSGVRTILNPAPGRPLPADLLTLSDIVVPNETETEIITGMPVETKEQIEAAALRLREMGARAVVITLGERGALLLNSEGTTRVAAEAIQVVDTTGAGDSFIGSLAYFWGLGRGQDEAVRRANAIAARSVGKVGAQVSFPRRSEIADLLE
jgi:ribokinase